MDETKDSPSLYERIKKAIEIAELARVNVTLTSSEARLLLDMIALEGKSTSLFRTAYYKLKERLLQMGVDPGTLYSLTNGELEQNQSPPEEVEVYENGVYFGRYKLIIEDEPYCLVKG